jgi:Protein of unknown function (DUF4058)
MPNGGITMPLREHFRLPVSKRVSWEMLFGMWPMAIVQQLRNTLPPGYTAGPSVRVGTFCEIDGADLTIQIQRLEANAVDVKPDEEYEYTVYIYDTDREQTLVAAIEIVSPANKDHPEKRNSFVAKCVRLLRSGVSVSLVDLVTVRNFNLYTQLIEFIRQPNADRMSVNPPATYAAACRWGKWGEKTRLEAWSHTMTDGEPLPTLPLWLTAELVIPLDLEKSYEQACHDLWII